MSLMLEFVSCVVKNLVNIPEDMMRYWIKNPKALQRVLRKALCPSSGVETNEKQCLLSCFATQTVDGALRFVCDEATLKAANVGCMGENFKRIFLNKVEENIPDANLVASQLKKASLDAPILTDLGEKAETSLVYMFDLIKEQANSYPSILLTNSSANVFYIRDNDRNLWAVSVAGSQGPGVLFWRIEASSLGNQQRWPAHCRFFSRDY